MKTLSLLALVFAFSAHAAEPEVNLLDELNPFDPNVEQLLEQYDRVYEEGTGQSAHIGQPEGVMAAPNCFRSSCYVWLQIVKSTQNAYLYVDGVLQGNAKVSTGARGYTTPNFDRHPDGRIYDAYSSTKYPGGDYRGLGNMPYAVFIQGGFAVHGTPESNWPNLGRPASHGCIRIHPDRAFRINRLVRQYGIQNTWITVQE